MAKLIVIRARQVADRLWRYRIAIDGQQPAMIAPGKTVEIELTAGRHEPSPPGPEYRPSGWFRRLRS